MEEEEIDEDVQTTAGAPITSNRNNGTVLSTNSASQASLSALRRRKQQRASSARFRISKQ